MTFKKTFVLVQVGMAITAVSAMAENLYHRAPKWYGEWCKSASQTTVNPICKNGLNGIKPWTQWDRQNGDHKRSLHRDLGMLKGIQEEIEGSWKNGRDQRQGSADEATKWCSQFFFRYDFYKETRRGDVAGFTASAAQAKRFCDEVESRVRGRIFYPGGAAGGGFSQNHRGAGEG